MTQTANPSTPIAEESAQPDYSVCFEHSNGKLFLGNSIDWLRSLAAESVDLVFADPPYNLNKAAWDNFESQEQYIEWSLQWIEEASRVLKKTRFALRLWFFRNIG